MTIIITLGIMFLQSKGCRLLEHKHKQYQGPKPLSLVLCLCKCKTDDSGFLFV